MRVNGLLRRKNVTYELTYAPWAPWSVAAPLGASTTRRKLQTFLAEALRSYCVY